MGTRRNTALSRVTFFNACITKGCWKYASNLALLMKSHSGLFLSSGIKYVVFILRRGRSSPSAAKKSFEIKTNSNWQPHRQCKKRGTNWAFVGERWLSVRRLI